MSYTDEKIQGLSYRISELNNLLRSFKAQSNGGEMGNTDLSSINDLTKQMECNNQLRYIELQLQLGLMSKEDAKEALIQLRSSVSPVRKHRFF